MMINFNLIDESPEIKVELLDDNNEINFSMTDYDDTNIKEQINNLEETKQNKLISGQNIKTINNQSILGSGNIEIESGSPDYPDLTNKPKINNVELVGNKSLSDLGIQPAGNYATRQELTNESTARENADIGLQEQIDAITVSSDVIDVLGTYQDLQNYDTSHVKANDIIKVLQDSTHSNAMSYYRWVKIDHIGSWVYVGSEGPYYTKSEADTLLNAKQNTITSSNKLLSDLVDDTNQTNKFVTNTEKTTWNNKQNALVSGTNIKTINNESILGEGNITISSGSSDYTQLTNNPYILKTNTTNTSIFSLLPESGRITYQFLNACNLSAPTKNGTLTIQLAPGNTVTMSTDEVSLVCPGGNYYIYPDETPVTGQTTWSGGYCPTYDDVETMVMNAGGWIIQTSGTATGTVNMTHGQMFKKTRTTGVTRLTIKFPDEIDENYKSRLVLNTASSFSSFTITEPDYDVYFYGDDCANGVITGVAGKYYDMIARADGFGGVLIEVFAKENS